MPITVDELRQSSFRYRAQAFDSAINAKSYGVRTAFLCHSHLDKELVRGLAQRLAEVGVKLYIDWIDGTMPDKPNKTTAEKLQDRINAADTFMFLATANSVASRWCPWEIGYADGKKGNNWIVVVPTSSGYSTHGSEYLDLYRRLDKDISGGLSIYSPGSSLGSNVTFAL